MCVNKLKKYLIITGVVIFAGLIIFLFSIIFEDFERTIGVLCLLSGVSLGIAISGWGLVINRHIITSFHNNTYANNMRKVRRWQGYTDKHMEDDSLMFPWSRKSRQVHGVVVIVVLTIFNYIFSVLFIACVVILIMYLIGVDISGPPR